MATERQAAANRLNALKSTGPRTDGGKDACRRNALKHGLAAVTLDDPGRADEQAERVESWGAEIRPATRRAGWALGRAVAASFQIEGCERDFEALAVDHKARAKLSWEEDRRAEAADLADGLARKPTRVARRLESTRHGAELMIERWERLGEAADSEAGWGPVEVSAALDLLGVAAELRQGRTPADPAPGSDPAAHRRELVRRQVDRLQRCKVTSLDALDDLARRQSEAGALLTLTKPCQLLQRYQRDAWRRYHAAIKAAHAPAPDLEDEEPATIRVADDPEPAEEDVPREPAHLPTTPEEIRAEVEAIQARARAARTEVERRHSRMEIDAALAMFGPEVGIEMPSKVAEPHLNRHARRALEARSRRG